MHEPDEAITEGGHAVNCAAGFNVPLNTDECVPCLRSIMPMLHWQKQHALTLFVTRKIHTD